MSVVIQRPIEIMLIEDNAGDVRLTQEAMKENKVHNTLHVMRDGESALQALSGGNGFGAHPDLILLDLNLPGMNGQEVLHKIKSNPETRSIPVVILTTSNAEEDVARSYSLHANCYVTKPVDLAQFLSVVRSVDSFWLSVVTLPHKDG
jgi:CheY-like chemotaxis protein